MFEWQKGLLTSSLYEVLDHTVNRMLRDAILIIGNHQSTSLVLLIKLYWVSILDGYFREWFDVIKAGSALSSYLGLSVEDIGSQIAVADKDFLVDVPLLPTKLDRNLVHVEVLVAALLLFSCNFDGCMRN